MLEQVYFDMVIGLAYYSILTLINIYGYERDVPLIQMSMFGVCIFSIVPWLEQLKDAGLATYGMPTLLFVVSNTVIFVAGMAKYRKLKR